MALTFINFASFSLLQEAFNFSRREIGAPEMQKSGAEHLLCKLKGTFPAFAYSHHDTIEGPGKIRGVMQKLGQPAIARL